MDSTLTPNAERAAETLQREDARREVYEASPASDPRSPV